MESAFVASISVMKGRRYSCGGGCGTTTWHGDAVCCSRRIGARVGASGWEECGIGHGVTRMLQRPDGDGPPGLESLRASQQVTSSMRGPPVRFGTARRVIGADADVAGEARECVRQALASLQDGGNGDDAGKAPGVAHVTLTPDLPAVDVAAGVSSALSSLSTGVLGRTTCKEGATRTLEVLLLAGGHAFAVGVGRGDSVRDAVFTAAKAAAEGTGGAGVFAVFAASAACAEADVRAALADAYAEGFPAYGGAAQGEDAWALLCDGGVTDADSDSGSRSHSPFVVSVALVAGAASFLLSAVIKNWTQPKFTDKLNYLKPAYVDNPVEDLLTAIKFDDWQRFLYCLQDCSVDVNVKWTARQNQSPLLAAAGRGRTRMLQYLIDHGADIKYRNAGGFNAVMYTLRLRDYGDDFVKAQLQMLEKGGADLNDTDVIIP